MARVLGIAWRIRNEHPVGVFRAGLDPLAADETLTAPREDRLFLPVGDVGTVGIVHDLRDSHGQRWGTDTPEGYTSDAH